VCVCVCVCVCVRVRARVWCILERTTYNSYIITENGKVALIDTAPSIYGKLYVEKLNSVLADLNVKTIDFLIIQHVDAHHIGMISQLLAIPNFVKTLVATPAAFAALRSKNIGIGFPPIEISNDSTRIWSRIKFIPLKDIHSADTMLTFDEKSQVLYTCDAFSAHFYQRDGLFDVVGSKLIDFFRQFYKDVFQARTAAIKKLNTKVKELSPAVIAPGHGPCLKDTRQTYISEYIKLAQTADLVGDREIVDSGIPPD